MCETLTSACVKLLLAMVEYESCGTPPDALVDIEKHILTPTRYVGIGSENPSVQLDCVCGSCGSFAFVCDTCICVSHVRDVHRGVPAHQNVNRVGACV